MNILLVHNYYRDRGGEDAVFEDERDLLRKKGHTVFEFLRESSTISKTGVIRAGVSALWSADTKNDLGRLLALEKIDVVHVHNTFPLVSPSVYSVCRKARVPIVQTLHNYRWLCASGTLYRDGAVCTECLTFPFPFPAVLHGCYHQSRVRSLAAGGVQMVQRGLKIRDDISLFIAPTEFVRDIFPPQFLNPGKVVVKPHFVQTDPGQRNTRGSYALYLGRLSEEKGVRSLMKAWKNIPEVPLVVVGDGPLRGETLAFVSDQNLKSVEMIGYKPPGEVVRLLKNSAFLILPSICYEVFPRVIVEAFSCGVPVLVPSHGAPAELVADSVTGLWFEPADEADLAAKVRWAWTHPDEMELMGKRARAEFESKYTADRNYDLLFRIYQRVIEEGLPA